MFNKILIANRGEIALRIIRTCKELGIPTVAVYSEADEDSLHVLFADEAVCIGPPNSRESYLKIPNIMSAAQITGADAIHPGYGFLAENADFSEICVEHEIKFIGPSPDMITKMGDKALAKETMRNVGVPVVPGSDGVVKTIEEAKKIAAEIGYPVMLKASAGGGGKGMRIVWEDSEITKAFQTASNEAEAAFGEPALYLEKFIESPRHVEIQVMGDQFGNVYQYGERDCTVQRRHQKLIEESPSPVISQETRQKMADAAVLGAKSVNYEGAGTIEFLVDKNQNFYFIEMNTRIQVEHPVTEMVNNVDLIKQQILAAAGKKIEDVPAGINGHSIEFRINAEDPDNNFRPSPGKIEYLHFPGGFGVRVDSHVYNEYLIPPFYDSLIAKLIVWGTDRTHAIARAKRAFEEFTVEGVKTTIPFHQEVIENEYFLNSDYDTNSIDKLFTKSLEVKMNVPAELKYTKDHEWLKIEGTTGTIGITDYAQGELGDVVFVDIDPDLEDVNAGDSFGTIEAVKTVSDLFAPITAKIIEVNPKLQDNPELVNSDPYGEGWLVKVELSEELPSDLLDAEGYSSQLS